MNNHKTVTNKYASGAATTEIGITPTPVPTTYYGGSLSGASATCIVYSGTVDDANIIDYLVTGSGAETVTSPYNNGLCKRCLAGIIYVTTGAGAKAAILHTID